MMFMYTQMTKRKKVMKMTKIQANMMKVTVTITEIITRTQKKTEGNPDHYYILKTEMTLIWNTTQKK